MICRDSSLGFIVALWETCCLSCYSVEPLAECVLARAEGVKTDARRVTVRALSKGWNCAMCSFPSLCAVTSVESGPVFFCLPFLPSYSSCFSILGL